MTHMLYDFSSNNSFLMNESDAGERVLATEAIKAGQHQLNLGIILRILIAKILEAPI